MLPEALELDSSKLEDDNAYPINLRVKHLKDEEITENQNGLGISDDTSSLAKDDLDELISQNREKAGSVETIRAKYAIGCDGAHSWTRQQLGFTMEGERTDFVWGVMEIIPITDFREAFGR